MLVLTASAQAIYRFWQPTDGWAMLDAGSFEGSVYLFSENVLGEPTPIEAGDRLLAVTGEHAGGCGQHTGRRGAVPAVACSVQAFIDQRFFRRRYDAQQVLREFAERAQHQPELDALGADVIATVRQTLEPESAQLWFMRRWP